jgi:hypothetical protein
LLERKPFVETHLQIRLAHRLLNLADMAGAQPVLAGRHHPAPQASPAIISIGRKTIELAAMTVMARHDAADDPSASFRRDQNVGAC